MQVDTEYLRKHYASLTDEALLDVNRSELTEAAQQCYDDELKERRLDPEAGADEPDSPPEPEWAAEAAGACTFTTSSSSNTTPEAAHALEILENSGIACYLSSEKADDATYSPIYEIRVMVPGNLSLLAQSILDKEIFNAEVETEWKTYFENPSDEELRDTDTKQLFCGILDRIERLTNAYNEEKSRRGI